MLDVKDEESAVRSFDLMKLSSKVSKSSSVVSFCWQEEIRDWGPGSDPKSRNIGIGSDLRFDLIITVHRDLLFIFVLFKIEFDLRFSFVSSLIWSTLEEQTKSVLSHFHTLLFYIKVSSGSHKSKQSYHPIVKLRVLKFHIYLSVVRIDCWNEVYS